MAAKNITSFSISGKAADARAVGEAKALAADHRRKRAKAEREAATLKNDADRVGAAIRRKVREDERSRLGMITVRPARRSGQRRSRTICPRFASALDLHAPKPSKVGSDGLSSFHFKWTSRGTRPRKGQKNAHRYRGGEAVRHVCYILRDDAREVEGGGIVSNISTDPDEIASLFGAIEELERIGGRDNANVYCSIVIALPKELDSWARERVLGAIGEELEKEVLPYAFVLHKPDIRGSQDNWHAHGMLSLRPFRKRDDGSYDFASAPSSDLNDGDFIYHLREAAARAMNVEMARLEVEQGKTFRRFTHLSKQDRGLDEASETKKGPGLKQIERREQDLDAMRTERTILSRFTDTVEKFGRRLGEIAARPVRDRDAILASLRDQVRTAGQQADAIVAADPTHTQSLPTRRREAVVAPEPNAPIGNSQLADDKASVAGDRPGRPSGQPKPPTVAQPAPSPVGSPDDDPLWQEILRRAREGNLGR